jgi:hypothetical protein
MPSLRNLLDSLEFQGGFGLVQALAAEDSPGKRV